VISGREITIFDNAILAPAQKNVAMVNLEVV